MGDRKQLAGGTREEHGEDTCLQSSTQGMAASTVQELRTILECLILSSLSSKRDMSIWMHDIHIKASQSIH